MQTPVHVEIVNDGEDPYRPAKQGPVQLAFGRPVVAPYKPAAHGVHTAAFARLYWPATHIVCVALIDPAAQ